MTDDIRTVSQDGSHTTKIRGSYRTKSSLERPVSDARSADSAIRKRGVAQTGLPRTDDLTDDTRERQHQRRFPPTLGGQRHRDE